jgi:FMN-dependent NADH-azoreductase
MKLLYVPASPHLEASTSREVAGGVLKKMKAQHPELQIIQRDVALEPLPHWEARQIRAGFTPPENRSNVDQMVLKKSDELCSEIKGADLLLIATPMWNFGIPSTLKAWIDHIVRAGVTFRYGPHGPEGLLTNISQLVIVESAGGYYGQSSGGAVNHCSTYLRDIFGFLGVKNISIIEAHGTAVSIEQTRASASEQVAKLYTS